MIRIMLCWTLTERQLTPQGSNKSLNEYICWAKSSGNFTYTLKSYQQLQAKRRLRSYFKMTINSSNIFFIVFNTQSCNCLFKSNAINHFCDRQQNKWKTRWYTNCKISLISANDFYSQYFKAPFVRVEFY